MHRDAQAAGEVFADRLRDRHIPADRIPADRIVESGRQTHLYRWTV